MSYVILWVTVPVTLTHPQLLKNANKPGSAIILVTSS